MSDPVLALPSDDMTPDKPVPPFPWEPCPFLPEKVPVRVPPRAPAPLKAKPWPPNPERAKQ